MDRLPAGLTPTRLVASLGVVVLMVAAGRYVTGWYYGSPCHDDLAISPPERHFDVHQSSEGVTIEFESGKPFTTSNTVSVVVLVEDANSTHSERVVWGTNESGAFPIAPGDRFQLNETTLGSMDLDSGDEIQLRWEGVERPLPSYCLNSRGDHVVTATYARYQVR